MTPPTKPASNIVDGLPELSTGRTDGRTDVDSNGSRDHQADRFIKATGAAIRHGHNEAAYMPALDHTVMPPFGAFKTMEGYYATCFHGLGRYSGHSTRLDRKLDGHFGTRSYAAEELIAELTSVSCIMFGY